MKTWHERNKDLLEMMRLVRTLTLNTKLDDDYLEWGTPFLYYCVKDTWFPEFLSFKNGRAVFLVPLSEFDPNGWLSSDGSVFNERFEMITEGPYTQGNWRQLDFTQLLQLMDEDVRALHPQFELLDIASLEEWANSEAGYAYVMHEKSKNNPLD